MGWSEYAALIGAVSGVISLLGLIYLLGYKLGNMETRLGNVESNQIDKETFGSLSQCVDTLHQVYVVQVLRDTIKPNKQGMSGE